MQREEGFNTKMADGPDEYDTETGCVPLLHPEEWCLVAFNSLCIQK
ncbi:rCG48691, isoform CRA_a [Rattus norvegicus]|uniref:RCG48691, isoform CRA_a n=1 Tax=Rattus norvegicus TaxID=10116 RepID=A6IGF6_RAT|nr:rCG48691, isoform CRA_a [Rattus norvegicus]